MLGDYIFCNFSIVFSLTYLWGCFDSLRIERTIQVPLGSIRDCDAQPIPGHLGYHILGIQLGPTSKSMNFFYWFPSQYVSAVKVLLSK